MKAELDSGAASTLADAVAKFHGYKLHLAIDAGALASKSQQVALLTTVALARRVFLGGVTVSGVFDTPCLAPFPICPTLANAVRMLGGQIGEEQGEVRIQIGGGAGPRRCEFHVRTAFAGWRGGVLPVGDHGPSVERSMPLSPMLSAALAVSEALSYVRREGGAAGYRALGLSLWQPAPCAAWLATDGAPSLTVLPTKLWLLSLGHLGQAFLWALGLLPYSDPSRLQLVLQDTDIVTTSTESTSVLSDLTLVGQKKTRAMAAWAEQRGFSTAIVERWFDGTFRRHASEPRVALCGLDNAEGRRVLDQVGFDFIVEAGLGRGHDDFRRMRLHTLPGSRAAAGLWKPRGDSADRPLAQAYGKMIQRHELDQCGATLLAGKAVGAPFVGAVAACLAISEVLRLLHQGPLHQVCELDLEALDQRVFVPHSNTFSSLNPGFVEVAPESDSA
ncbi:MAG TPA: hypothetical protein VK745_18440 [Polyangiaceae bacterium]|nr:hypothetical protein [Polyangiaceae bacterium]